MAFPAGRERRMALMMQLWFSSSEMTTVSLSIIDASVPTTAAYADEKIMPASRRWNAARARSRVVWAE